MHGSVPYIEVYVLYIRYTYTNLDVRCCQIFCESTIALHGFVPISRAGPYAFFDLLPNFGSNGDLQSYENLGIARDHEVSQEMHFWEMASAGLQDRSMLKSCSKQPHIGVDI